MEARRARLKELIVVALKQHNGTILHRKFWNVMQSPKYYGAFTAGEFGVRKMNELIPEFSDVISLQTNLGQDVVVLNDTQRQRESRSDHLGNNNRKSAKRVTTPLRTELEMASNIHLHQESAQNISQKNVSVGTMPSPLKPLKWGQGAGVQAAPVKTMIVTPKQTQPIAISDIDSDSDSDVIEISNSSAEESAHPHAKQSEKDNSGFLSLNVAPSSGTPSSMIFSNTLAQQQQQLQTTHLLQQQQQLQTTHLLQQQQQLQAVHLLQQQQQQQHTATDPGLTQSGLGAQRVTLLPFPPLVPVMSLGIRGGMHMLGATRLPQQVTLPQPGMPVPHQHQESSWQTCSQVKSELQTHSQLESQSHSRVESQSHSLMESQLQSQSHFEPESNRRRPSDVEVALVPEVLKARSLLQPTSLDPSWPPVSPRLGIPPNMPRERKEVVVKPLSFQRISKEQIEGIAQECIEMLAEAGDFVGPERILHLLCQRLSIRELRELGLPNVRFPYQINCLNEHERTICKVNASIEAFVKIHSTCTLYELGESLREYAPDKGQFEKLHLGPLQCLPVVYKHFKFPSEEVIPDITTADVMEALSDYLSMTKSWTSKSVNMEDVMKYFMERYQVSSAYSLGIRLRSLPLIVQVLKKSHRDAANTKRSIFDRFKSNVEAELSAACKKVKATILQTGEDGVPELRHHYAKMSAETVMMELAQKFQMLISIDITEQQHWNKHYKRLVKAVTDFFEVMQKEPLIRALMHLAVCVGTLDLQEAAMELLTGSKPGSSTGQETAGSEQHGKVAPIRQPPSKDSLVEKVKTYVERCLAQGSLTLQHLDRIEEKLLEDFGFATFVSLGFGRFLQFLLQNPATKTLLEECGGTSLGSSASGGQNTDSGFHPQLTEVLEFIRQCHTAGFTQEEDVEWALSHQFNIFEAKSLGYGNMRRLITAAEKPGKHHSKDYHVWYETAFCGRTSEPVHGRRTVGILGNQSREAALACLQSCPLLEDLHRWSHWQLVFEPQYGRLKDFLQKYGGIYTLKLEDGRKSVTTNIIALETESGHLLRLTCATSPADYNSAISRGDARTACGHLASLVAANRGKEHTPLALLANHTKTALFAMHAAATNVPGGPSLINGPCDPAVQFVVDCLLILPTRLCVAVADQVFLEPLGQVVGSSKSKSLILEACRGSVTRTHSGSSDAADGWRSVGGNNCVMELARLGCLLGVQEWVKPLTDQFVFPAQLMTINFPQPKPVIKDELFGDEDLEERSEEESCSEEESDEDLEEESLLSDEDEPMARVTTVEATKQTQDTSSSEETENGNCMEQLEKLKLTAGKDATSEMEVISEFESEEDEEEEEDEDDDEEEEEEEEEEETLEDGCKRIIDQIRHEEFGIGVELSDDGHRLMKVQQERLGRSLDRLSRDLYSKDTHFVLELVQNADDNSYPDHLLESSVPVSLSSDCPSVCFIINTDGVTVLNNECGFNERDVRALCDVGRSTKGKHKYGYIGQKGIGFKSVFRVTNRPELHSNGFHFYFDVESGPMGYILPHWCKDIPQESGWMTKIILPFKESLTTETRSLAARFNDVHPSLLLFLHRLRRIHIDNKVEGTSLSMCRVDLGDNIIEIHHGQGKTDRWLVVKKQLDASNISTQAKSGVEVESTEIALAFPIRTKGQKLHSQTLPAKQPVFAFLPLRSYGFRFIVQGDFDVPSSREDVDRDSFWNQWLRNEIHTLFVEAFNVFRTHPEFEGLDSLWTFLQFVPLEDEILDFFKPVAAHILQQLRATPCMPILTSGKKKGVLDWKIPSQTVMVRDALVGEVISPDLLEHHLGLYYIHSDAVAMLNQSLARSLGIETITTEHLLQIGRSLVSSWSQVAGGEVVQVAKWLACIYRSLDDFQENSSLLNSMRSMRIIPLSSGQFVSLDEVTVFMLLDEQNVQSNKQDAINVLRCDLRLVHVGLTNVPDNEVNSQVIKLLLKLGVKQMYPADIIHHHILPILKSDQWRNKDRAVLVSYLVYIKEQHERDKSIINMDELRSVARVYTNHGVKNPATEAVHFSPHYQVKMDLKKHLPGYDWVLLENDYLPKQASVMEVRHWQEFFLQLGVSVFLYIKQQEVKLKQTEIDSSPWADFKDLLPNSSDGYTIQDFVCEEFTELVTNNSASHLHIAQMKALFSMLESLWESQYSHCTSAKLYTESGIALKEDFPSSFTMALLRLKWIPAVETKVTVVGGSVKIEDTESLQIPSLLYIPDPAIKRLLAHSASYLASSAINKPFLAFLHIKLKVEIQVIHDTLVQWGKRDPASPNVPANFCSSLSHMQHVYDYLCENLPRKEAQDLFHHNAVIFVPEAEVSAMSSVHGRPESHQPVMGKMLGRDEVWWYDSSGLFLKYRLALLEFHSTLAHRQLLLHHYRNVEEIFLRTARVQKEPTLSEFAELLVLLSSALSLKEEGLMVDIIAIYAKIGHNLSIDHDPSMIEHFEQAEQKRKIVSSLSNRKVLATKKQMWVSMEDMPLHADNSELEKMFVDKPGVHFIATDLQPARAVKRVARNKDANQPILDDVLAFYKLFNIALLSDMVQKEEIPEMFTPCAQGQLYLQTIVPYIQQFLISLFPEVHDAHQAEDMASRLKALLFVKVRKLEVRYFLKTLPDVYEIRPERCVITGNHFYFHEKYVDNLMEINKEVAHYFSNGNEECMKELKYFLTDIQHHNKTEAELKSFLTKYNVIAIPEGVEPWEVPPPAIPEPPPRPPPLPAVPADILPSGPVGDKNTQDAETTSSTLKSWPPTGPGEHTAASDPNRKKVEGKALGAGVWPPPKPPEGPKQTSALPSNLRIASTTSEAASKTHVTKDDEAVFKHQPSNGRQEHRRGSNAGQSDHPTGEQRQEDATLTGKRKVDPDKSELLDSKRQVPDQRQSQGPAANQERDHAVSSRQPAHVQSLESQIKDAAAEAAGGTVVAMEIQPQIEPGQAPPKRSHSQLSSKHHLPSFRRSRNEFQQPMWSEWACETEYEALEQGDNLKMPTSILLTDTSDRSDVGRWGEQLVYDYLLQQKELHSDIYEVIWANGENESGKPYDFEVICTTDEEAYTIYIEVKATRSSQKEVFEISSNQVKFASQHAEHYHIYRIFNAGKTSNVQLVRLTNVAQKMETKEVKLWMVI